MYTHTRIKSNETNSSDPRIPLSLSFSHFLSFRTVCPRKTKTTLPSSNTSADLAETTQKRKNNESNRIQLKIFSFLFIPISLSVCLCFLLFLALSLPASPPPLLPPLSGGFCWVLANSHLFSLRERERASERYGERERENAMQSHSKPNVKKTGEA